MDWIFASHRNSNPDGPMVLDAGGMGQVEGGKPKHIGSMKGRRG
jgi:hypothetical protein